MINDLNQQVLHQQQHPHDAEMERRLSLQQQSQHQVSQLSNGGGGYQQLHTVHSSPNMLQTAVNSISQQPHSAPIVVQSPPGMTNIFKTLRTPGLAVRNTPLTNIPKEYLRNDSKGCLGTSVTTKPMLSIVTKLPFHFVGVKDNFFLQICSAHCGQGDR